MKRLMSALLMFAVLLALLSNLSVTVSAESLYIRKIVSVVYDDSGSMGSDSKYAYANYAMQVFCGMLNSEDQLYVTYMSNPGESVKIDLSSDGIQDSIDYIRSQTVGGTTPYEAVETAYSTLASISDSNVNTQYWLVVITDGAFDECSKQSDGGKSYLNDSFEEYAESKMDNGTNPQIMFLSIGSNVTSPDEDENKGIYTYSAKNADEIIDVMSDMADKISGRTRLDSDDVEQVSDNSIQVTSSIPLLNIVCFVQDSEAKVTNVNYRNESNVVISREADLSYPGFSELIGSAYLIGNSEEAMGSGTYTITFDQSIDLDDVIILFEPALEVKMAIILNGEEIFDFDELDDAMEGDTVSVSCKIYEMGTDTEVDSSLLPPGTGYEIAIAENGSVVDECDDEEMILSDYTLSNVETEIIASVTIEGFNPIEYSVKFTPTVYIPRTVYTIEASFGSATGSVKFDDIADNTDLTVCFTVFADGEAITDVDTVMALNPVITVSPDGNDGTIAYSDDGKIVFTPNSATVSTGTDDSFDVEVTCTIGDGVTASQTYTVLISEYQVIAVDTDETITKTEFYGNKVGVSFYITKDGVQLDKEAVEKYVSVTLNDEYSDLETSVTVADDGTITAVPYSDEEHKLTFWRWWTNWAYYFGLPGKDVTITMTHSYGTASSTINVVGKDILYLLLCVFLPLIIELATLATLIAWLYCVITKPRYAKNVALYVGTIQYNQASGTHSLWNLTSVKLDKYNKIEKGNGRLKFKRSADEIVVNGIRIQAERGDQIICHEKMPWYKNEINPINTDSDELSTPEKIENYFLNNYELEIEEFPMIDSVSESHGRKLRPRSPEKAMYYISDSCLKLDDIGKIERGRIFAYVYKK